MPRPRKAPLFELGGQWLAREPGRTGFWRFWYDAGTQKVRRQRLGGLDLEAAKLELAQHVLRAEAPRRSSPLAAVMLRYHEERSDKVRSAKMARAASRKALAFFGADAAVCDLTEQRQASFVIRLARNTKDKEERTVPLTARAAQILAQLPVHIKSPLVFCHVKGEHSGEGFDSMYKGLVAAVKRAGIPHCSWHDLRRTAGCRWIQRDGKTLDEVKELMGHESVRTTEKIYAFLIGEDIARSLGAAQKPEQRSRIPG